MARPVMPLKARFMSFVKKSKSCWEWTGQCDGFGYGRILITLDVNTRKLVRTHRLSCELFIGEIPGGMCICHRCDNPRCVNPDHLFAATQGENMRDMLCKGRGNHQTKRKYIQGEECHLSKVSMEDVIELRDRCDRGESVASVWRSMQLPITYGAAKKIDFGKN